MTSLIMTICNCMFMQTEVQLHQNDLNKDILLIKEQSCTSILPVKEYKKMSTQTPCCHIMHMTFVYMV